MSRKYRKNRPVRKEVYFSDKEWGRVEKRMSRVKNFCFSDFARQAVSGDVFKVDQRVEQVVSREVMFELHAIGSNMNQIAHNSNMHGATTQAEIRKALELIEDLALTLQPMRIQLSSQYTHCPTCKQPVNHSQKL